MKTENKQILVHTSNGIVGFLDKTSLSVLQADIKALKSELAEHGLSFLFLQMIDKHLGKYMKDEGK